MDPLSLTASIIAVIQLTATALSYLNDVKDAPKERARCTVEAANLLGLLTNLRFRVEDANPRDPWFTSVRSLAVENGPLDQYKVALENLVSKIAPKDGAKAVYGALLWKFDKKDIDGILSRIERLKSLIQVALETDHFKLSQAIKDDTQDLPSLVRDVEAMRIYQGRDHVQRVSAWLSSIDFTAQQTDCSSKRQEGTGTWFIQSPEYIDWLKGSKQTLFCPGIPGAGKTMISSLVIDHLWSSRRGNETGIAFVYCNYKKYEEQKATDLLCILLKQLVQEKSTIPDSLRELYERHSRRGTRPALNEISKTLHDVIRNYQTVYIVVDALDECEDRGDFHESLLSELQSLKPLNTKLLITSRFITSITEQFEEETWHEIRAHDEDVRRYVEGHISHWTRRVFNNGDLKEMIVSRITDAVQGMFLLAPLHLDSLADKTTAKAVKNALNNLPYGSSSLDLAYKEAIERIERKGPELCALAKEALSWIVYAKRQLTLEELQTALAIEVDEGELDEENIADISDVVSICAGLITTDEESKIVRLVHYTTQEFFQRNLATWFPDAQSMIVSKCITYLKFDTFQREDQDEGVDLDQSKLQNPFLDYAVHFWGRHCTDFFSQDPVTTPPDGVVALALSLLQDPFLLSYSGSSYKQVSGVSYYEAAGLTYVHLAAYFGITVLCDYLLREERYGIDANSQDCLGRTPLSWAAIAGQETVVRYLLARNDVDLDSRDFRGRTPFALAVMCHRETVIQLLLERKDLNVNSRDDIGRTPLHLALDEEVWDLLPWLLELKNFDVNQKDNQGFSPLHSAASSWDSIPLMELLQREDLDVTIQTNDGQTPLFLAVRHNRKGNVRLLLGRQDVKSHLQLEGEELLSIAEEEGFEEIAGYLSDAISKSRGDRGNDQGGALEGMMQDG